MMFQSLTGSIHTLLSQNYYYLVFHCFNPSQVQFTLIYRSETNQIDFRFQSLTGSIHTNS